jgi:hypothetical protein
MPPPNIRSFAVLGITFAFEEFCINLSILDH